MIVGTRKAPSDAAGRMMSTVSTSSSSPSWLLTTPGMRTVSRTASR
jgi:hypothetical protein